MDIRDQLVAEKHYAFIPIPVLEMLARARLSAPQMAIYMLHWSSGHIRGDWTSNIAVSVIMKRFQISRATVHRAYKGLVKKGLLRREKLAPGCYSIPDVQVLIPDEAQEDLIGTPNRLNTGSSWLGIEGRAVKAPDPAPSLNEAGASQEAVAKTESSIDGSSLIGGDEEGGPSDLAEFTRTMVLGSARLSRIFGRIQPGPTEEVPKPRKITPGMAYKLRDAIEATSPPELVFSRWQQALWSMEEGQLLSRPVPYAYNMIMWLLKRDIWRRPYGMPSDWTWSYGHRHHPDMVTMAA